MAGTPALRPTAKRFSPILLRTKSADYFQSFLSPNAPCIFIILQPHKL
jgi:hypothetical protein